MKGVMSTVMSLLERLSIVRVAIMAGTLHPKPISNRTEPTEVKAEIEEDGEVEEEEITDAIDVAVGYYHTLILRKDGTVWSAGYNHRGQLGDGSTVSTTKFHKVKGENGVGYLSNIVQIAAAGGGTSYALTADGSVYAWGYNYYGQLGTNTTSVENFVAARVVTRGLRFRFSCYGALFFRPVCLQQLNPHGREHGSYQKGEQRSPQSEIGTQQVNVGVSAVCVFAVQHGVDTQEFCGTVQRVVMRHPTPGVCRGIGGVPFHRKGSCRALQHLAVLLVVQGLAHVFKRTDIN